MSRTAYREAVRILAAKGLVDARPKVGTRINPRSQWNLLDPDVLDWTFESEPDLELLNSLFELRNVVESAAAGFAATRRSAAHLKAMRAALDGMAEHTLATPRGRQADLDFHTTLLDATDNPFIISLTSGVSAAISTTTMFKQRNGRCAATRCPITCECSTAIAAKDAGKAQQAMSELIELARADTPSSRRSDRRRRVPREVSRRRRTAADAAGQASFGRLRPVGVRAMRGTGLRAVGADPGAALASALPRVRRPNRASGH